MHFQKRDTPLLGWERASCCFMTGHDGSFWDFLGLFSCTKPCTTGWHWTCYTTSPIIVFSLFQHTAFGGLGKKKSDLHLHIYAHKLRAWTLRVESCSCSTQNAPTPSPFPIHAQHVPKYTHDINNTIPQWHHSSQKNKPSTLFLFLTVTTNTPNHSLRHQLIVTFVNSHS